MPLIGFNILIFSNFSYAIFYLCFHVNFIVSPTEIIQSVSHSASIAPLLADGMSFYLDNRMTIRKIPQVAFLSLLSEFYIEMRFVQGVFLLSLSLFASFFEGVPGECRYSKERTLLSAYLDHRCSDCFASCRGGGKCKSFINIDNLDCAVVMMMIVVGDCIDFYFF